MNWLFKSYLNNDFMNQYQQDYQFQIFFHFFDNKPNKYQRYIVHLPIHLINRLRRYRICAYQLQMSQIQLHLLQPMKKLEQVSMMKKLTKIQDQLKIVIGIWNMQGIIPPHNSIKYFMQEIINQQTQPDLICIATQECQRSINMSLFCENKQEWENALKEAASGYTMVESETMRALHTAILVKSDIANCYSTDRKTIMRAGTCNIFGNKGAISLVVNLLGQNFQFINCHLEAHQDQCPRRNQVLLRILNELVEKDYRSQVFIFGDLNYRIDMTHEEYYAYVKGKKNTDEEMKYSTMQERDQLCKQQDLKQKFLPFYQEMPVKFPPTYKIGDNNQEYDKKRIPGWTDRIFHRKGRARQDTYRCLYNLYGTDHRPILASFVVQTEQTLSIFPDEFVGVKTKDHCSLI